MKSHISAHITTPRDREVLNAIYTNLKKEQSSIILGMAGVGKDSIYTTLLEELDREKLTRIPKIIHATNIDELDEYVKELKDEPHTLAIINISSSEDFSELLKKLIEITNKNDSLYILFARPSNVTGDKNDYVLLPYTHSETDTILESLEVRYGFSLSRHDNETIYNLSRGNMGLIRALFFLKKNHPKQKLSEELALSDRSVIDYLREIEQDMNAVGADLKKYGFMSDSKPFTPLLKDSQAELSISFTTPEKIIFELLTQQKGGIVSKKEIANILWEQNVKKHYSDWALDHVIQNLTDKLTTYKSLQTVQKIKGVGFRLVTQS